MAVVLMNGLRDLATTVLADAITCQIILVQTRTFPPIFYMCLCDYFG